MHIKTDEVLSRGYRFEFGENWARFLAELDERRITEAEEALCSMLGVSSLLGTTFLDAGSGSGLSSLAARRLGARVHSFDFDPRSVACTAELKRRYYEDDKDWVVERGSVLDPDYLKRLGSFQIVYSWGVLHHTGAMWIGLENVMAQVERGGTLFVAIYNDQNWKSRFWWFIKWIYNLTPSPFKRPYAYGIGCLAVSVNVIWYTCRLKPSQAIRPLLRREKKRGMGLWHDMIDWIGGFPYEFASFAVLEAYLAQHGFRVRREKRATSLGCHELVCVRDGQRELHKT
jgi:SAM-dependent methyltransferase